MSGLNQITVEDIAQLTRDERKRYCVQLATIALTELGWTTKQKQVARALQPHFQRLGLSSGIRQIERYVKVAVDEYRSGFLPEDIEATREVLGLDARRAAMKLWAAFDAMCPNTEAIEATVRAENAASKQDEQQGKADAKSARKVERSALRADIHAACRLAETAIKVDTHVAQLLGLYKTMSDTALMADTEQRRLALEMFERLAPMLSERDRATVRTALDAANHTAQSRATPVLQLVRGGEEE